MRPVLLLLFTVSASVAQEAPIGIIRGDLLSWSGTAAHGELVFRNGTNQVYQCSFDDHSYFERLKERINVTAMTRGDQVEVLSDRKPDTGICYARMVHVLEPAAGESAGKKRAARPSGYRALTETVAPRGDLTLAGVVLRVTGDELLLRTRANERRVVLLRSDTRYLGDGQTVERDQLHVNTRVFVRAGRNFEDRVEAYQVVWGDILAPVVQPRVIP